MKAPSMTKLSNSGTAVRNAIERILNLKAEQDGIAEGLKDLRAELKSREAEIGETASSLFKAAMLHRKGAKDAADALGATIDLLRRAGLDDAAADLALAE